MIDLQTYGWHDSLQPENAEGLPARVTAVHRERYELVCAHGVTYGRLKTSIYYGQGAEFPTVGDFILLEYQPDSDSLIIATLPRRSFFSRVSKDKAGHVEQALAANFDVVFVMTSLNHDFNPARLERYLTLAWQSGAVPIVALTKSDLTEDFNEQMEAVQNIAVGVDVIAVSAVTGQGIDRLSAYLQPGKTAVFLGSSGVGKSSLVNALAGETMMDVNNIREDDSRGRHTTTYRQLIMLPNGTMVIDTPGMRELGMWDVSTGLGEAFGDVETVLSLGCKFTDCHHRSEPGCAIKAAIESGELSTERWQSYLTLKHEAKYSEDKAGFLRDRQQWHKQLAMRSKQNQKSRGK